MRKRNKRR